MFKTKQNIGICIENVRREQSLRHNQFDGYLKIIFSFITVNSIKKLFQKSRESKAQQGVEKTGEKGLRVNKDLLNKTDYDTLKSI